MRRIIIQNGRWDNDEETWELTYVMRKDDLFSMEYAHKHKLTNTGGWKWAKNYKKLATTFFKVISRVNALQAQKKRARNKYKFGV